MGKSAAKIIQERQDEWRESVRRHGLADIRSAQAEIAQREKLIWRLVRRAYPVRSRVRWIHCGHLQTGKVLSHVPDPFGHNYGLKAHNLNTGLAVWVPLYFILEAEGEA